MLIQAEIDAVNARMPQVQQVREFRLLVKELDQDDGEVSVTMKVRRNAIAEKYAELIEHIYKLAASARTRSGRQTGALLDPAAADPPALVGLAQQHVGCDPLATGGVVELHRLHQVAIDQQRLEEGHA